MRKTLLAAHLLLAGAIGINAQTITSITATRHEITSALDAHPCDKAVRLLAPYSPAVDSTMAPVLGECDGGMDVYRPESPLSNWLADALLQCSASLFGTKADAAVYNMGGIRSNMPSGTINQGHIFEIAPFENYPCLVTMHGDDFLELCHNIASTYGEGISGVRIVANKRGQLIEATVDGLPIDPKRDYTVVTLNYLAEGNDHMEAFKKAVSKKLTQIPVRDILMDAVRTQKTISSKVDGRMTIVADGTAPHQAPYFAQGATTLRIFHTNDTHSQILPYNPHSTNRDMADKGGYIRRATFIAEQRAQSPGMLLFDAGDYSQGSLYYNLYKGEVEIALMNQMGYNAATIGNHEFDFGMDNMARIYRMARFPIVNCNYDFTGTVLQDIVKPYVVLERDGLRIGVTGIGCALDGMVAKHNCEGVVYTEPSEAIPAIVAKLRGEERCDIVICLSHIGYEADMQFIAQTRGIDIVIGGHSHTYMELPKWVKNADGMETPCYQMGKSGRFVGEWSLEIQR